MKRMTFAAAVAMVAMMAGACGSTTSSGTPAPSNNDTTGAADTTTNADTTTGNDTAAVADTGPVDTGPVDTGPVDTGPVDTGPPPSDKCVSTGNPQVDNMCVQNCGLKKCKGQIDACQTDINCGKLAGCLSKCAQNQPVDLPTEATWTCTQTCYFNYGDDATTEFVAQSLCLQSQCIKSNYSLPCGANVNCQNACAMDLCDKEVLECANEPACAAFFGCASAKCTNPATRQQCATDCSTAIVAKYGQAGAQKAQLAQTAVSLCAQSKCQ